MQLSLDFTKTPEQIVMEKCISVALGTGKGLTAAHAIRAYLTTQKLREEIYHG